MNVRAVWVIVSGLALAGTWSAPLCAQQAGLLDTYSFSSTNALVGQGGTVTVNRNGPKELIETSAGPQFHTVTLYDEVRPGCPFPQRLPVTPLRGFVVDILQQGAHYAVEIRQQWAEIRELTSFKARSIS